jgi:probable HAF family extracellular repeat protein
MFAGLISSVGVLPGDVGSHAYNVNASGTVVGYSYGGSGDPFGIEGIHHAYSYSAGTGVIPLGGSLGGSWTAASSINAVGQIVGIATNAANDGRPFVYQPPGPMQDLGTLPVSHNVNIAYDLNDSGTVVGSSGHAFRYAGSGPMQDLGTLPGGTYSTAYAINNNGVIVGSSDINSSGASRAFRYSGSGPMQDLGTLSSYYTSGSAANDINSDGTIVGYAYNGDPLSTNNRRAFRYTSTGIMQNLGALGVFRTSPGGSSQALGINDAGYIVGTSSSNSGPHAVLWTPDNTLIDLDLWLNQKSAAEGSHWTLTIARAINNNGLIVGDGSYDGTPYGFVLDASSLTPTPLTGDTNGDGTVDLTDLNNVLNNFGTTAAGNPGDENHDNKVDLSDLNDVLNNFGSSNSAALASVPEPTSVSLLALGATTLLTRRRRRPNTRPIIHTGRRIGR